MKHSKEAIVRYSPGIRLEGNHEKSHWGLLVSGLRFEAETSRIRRSSLNHSTVTLELTSTICCRDVSFQYVLNSRHVCNFS